MGKLKMTSKKKNLVSSTKALDKTSKDKFVLLDVSKEELDKRRIHVYPYLM